MIKPQTLKGFRDFLPMEARKRQYVINTLKDVFELYGFEPLETPTLEYDEILSGKYGDEGEKLMYRFEDNGKRKVAMRYDQTVPLARVVAQYQNEIAFPFKRYQIQPVWRAENTQKGRFREFLQCDIDIAGSDENVADAEIILIAYTAFKRLQFRNFKILINDRSTFEGLPIEAITIIDKLQKIGKDGVYEELTVSGITKSTDEAKQLVENVINREPTEYLQNIFTLIERMGVEKIHYEYSPTLARGLNYYTGIILEVESIDYPFGSLGAGGRYDNLVGMFANRQIPAVGFSFGRTIDAVLELNLFPASLQQSNTKALVTIFSENLKEKSLEITSQLRSNNIPTEIYLGEIKEKNPLEKQLKYADQKGIPYAIIIGEEENQKQVVTVKDLKQRKQEQMKIEEAIGLSKG